MATPRQNCAPYSRYTGTSTSSARIADVGRLVTQARGIGAKLAGALQVDRLGVEGAHERHETVHLHKLARILREWRQRPDRISVLIQTLAVLYFEFGNRLHWSSPRA